MPGVTGSRSGVLVRLLGMLEIFNGCLFSAKHVPGGFFCRRGRYIAMGTFAFPTSPVCPSPRCLLARDRPGDGEQESPFFRFGLGLVRGCLASFGQRVCEEYYDGPCVRLADLIKLSAPRLRWAVKSSSLKYVYQRAFTGVKLNARHPVLTGLLKRVRCGHTEIGTQKQGPQSLMRTVHAGPSTLWPAGGSAGAHYSVAVFWGRRRPSWRVRQRYSPRMNGARTLTRCFESRCCLLSECQGVMCSPS